MGAHPAVSRLSPVLLLAVDSIVVTSALPADCHREKIKKNQTKPKG